MPMEKKVARRGFASAAIDTNGLFIHEATWYTKLDEAPRDRDVFFEGYIKTQGLQGGAFLRILADGLKEGQEQAHLIISTSSDDVHGDTEWTYTSLRCFIPPEATGVWAEVGVFGTGKAWFDDVSLKADKREDTLETGVNLLKNPSLEDGARYWLPTTNIANPAINSGNPSIGPDGGKDFFLQVLGPGTQDNGYFLLYQSISGFYGHKGELTVTGWMRAEGLIGTGRMGIRALGITGEIG